MITAKWDLDKSPETVIKFDASFRKLSSIEKLDFLQDILCRLEQEYDAAYFDHMEQAIKQITKNTKKLTAKIKGRK